MRSSIAVVFKQQLDTVSSSVRKVIACSGCRKESDQWLNNQVLPVVAVTATVHRCCFVSAADWRPRLGLGGHREHQTAVSGHYGVWHHLLDTRRQWSPHSALCGQHHLSQWLLQQWNLCTGLVRLIYFFWHLSCILLHSAHTLTFLLTLLDITCHSKQYLV